MRIFKFLVAFAALLSHVMKMTVRFVSQFSFQNPSLFVDARLFMNAIGDVPGFTHSHHPWKGPIGDVNDPSFYGDVDGDIDGDIPAVELGDVDMGSILTGAPASAVVAKKMAVMKGIASPAKIAEFRRNRASVLSMPGRAIDSVIIPALFTDNGRIIQHGTERGVSGSLVKYNLAKHRVASPFTTAFKTVAGAGIGATTSVVMDAALVAPIQEYTVPMLFIVVSSSVLNARSGARYEVNISGVNEFNAATNQETWIVERSDVNRPVRLSFIPFVRVKDTVVPVLTAFGTVQGAVKTLTINIKGVDTTESVQVVAPGLDSEEMKTFCKAWNIPM